MICNVLLLVTNLNYRKKVTEVALNSVTFFKVGVMSFFAHPMRADFESQQFHQIVLDSKNSATISVATTSTDDLKKASSYNNSTEQLNFLSQVIDKSNSYIQLFKSRLGLLFDVTDKRTLAVHKKELMQTINQMQTDLEAAIAFYKTNHEMSNVMKDVFSKVELLFKGFAKDLISFHDKLDPSAYTVALARNLYNDMPVLKANIKEYVQQIEIIADCLKTYDLQTSEKVRLLGNQLAKFLEGVDQSSYAMVNAIRHRLNCK